MKKKVDRINAVLAHVLGLVVGFIGPLIIYLVAQDKYSKDNAKMALNWQISLVIYLVISIVLIYFIIGFFTFFVVIMLNLIFSIIGAVKAGDGEIWKYPMAIPFLH